MPGGGGSRIGLQNKIMFSHPSLKLRYLYFIDANAQRSKWISSCTRKGVIEIKDQHARVIKPDDARSHLGSTDYELTLLYPSWHRCNNIALPCDHRFAFQATYGAMCAYAAVQTKLRKRRHLRASEHYLLLRIYRTLSN
jgi:hypothetical protein